VPGHDYYTLNTKAGATLNAGVPYSIKLYEKISHGYLYLRVGNAGYYFLEKNMQDNTYERSLGQMKFQMTKHDLKIDHAFDKLYFDVYAHTDATNEGPKLPVFRESSVSQPNYNFSLHTPTAEPTFIHYSSGVRLILKERTYSHTKFDGVITSLEKQQTNFSFINKKLDGFEFNTNGDSFDGLLTRWLELEGEVALNWLVYSKDKNVTFPAISPVITSAFPKFKNSTFGSVTPGGVEITAFEYDNISNYDEFVDRTFGRNGKTIMEGAKKYKSVAEVFN
jgi:hypothetical protein